MINNKTKKAGVVTGTLLTGLVVNEAMGQTGTVDANVDSLLNNRLRQSQQVIQQQPVVQQPVAEQPVQRTQQPVVRRQRRTVESPVPSPEFAKFPSIGRTSKDTVVTLYGTRFDSTGTVVTPQGITGIKAGINIPGYTVFQLTSAEQTNVKWLKGSTYIAFDSTGNAHYFRRNDPKQANLRKFSKRAQVELNTLYFNPDSMYTGKALECDAKLDSTVNSISPKAEYNAIVKSLENAIKYQSERDIEFKKMSNHDIQPVQPDSTTEKPASLETPVKVDEDTSKTIVTPQGGEIKLSPTGLYFQFGAGADAEQMAIGDNGRMVKTDFKAGYILPVGGYCFDFSFSNEGNLLKQGSIFRTVTNDQGIEVREDIGTFKVTNNKLRVQFGTHEDRQGFVWGVTGDLKNQRNRVSYPDDGVEHVSNIYSFLLGGYAGQNGFAREGFLSKTGARARAWFGPGARTATLKLDGASYREPDVFASEYGGALDLVFMHGRTAKGNPRVKAGVQAELSRQVSKATGNYDQAVAGLGGQAYIATLKGVELHGYGNVTHNNINDGNGVKTHSNGGLVGIKAHF